MKRNPTAKWLLLLLAGMMLVMSACGEQVDQKGEIIVNTTEQLTQAPTAEEIPFSYPNTDLSGLSIEVLEKGVVKEAEETGNGPRV